MRCTPFQRVSHGVYLCFSKAVIVGRYSFNECRHPNEEKNFGEKVNVTDIIKERNAWKFNYHKM